MGSDNIDLTARHGSLPEWPLGVVCRQSASHCYLVQSRYKHILLASYPLVAAAGAFEIMKRPNLGVILFAILLFGGCDTAVYKELRQPQTGEMKDCLEMYPSSLIDLRGDEAVARQKVEMCVDNLKNRGFVVVGE